MKTRVWISRLVGLWPALLLGLASPRGYAIGGVGDVVIIGEDLTADLKWAREVEQWTAAIRTMTDQVNRADELIKIAGNPDQLVKQLFVESVPDLMKPLDDAITLETRQQALNLSLGLYTLGKKTSKLIDDANDVQPKYEAFGQTFERDPKRYVRYAFQQGMYERYKKAAANQEAVDKKEADVQRRALEQVKTAKTETEIALFNAKIAASKQRQDMAHQIATQAKGEMDAMNGELLIEDAKKAEADREWAQGVIDRMREKALSAYRAQLGSGDAVEK